MRLSLRAGFKFLIRLDGTLKGTKRTIAPLPKLSLASVHYYQTATACCNFSTPALTSIAGDTRATTS